MPVGRIRSYTAKPREVERVWYHADAKDQVLGRLSVKIATVLMGKHKPTYTPHVDTGDFVVVTNCGRFKLTGNKRQTMHYDRYTYYPGGFKSDSAVKLLEKYPDRVLRFAVRRMLPKNALGRHMLRKLKLYSGAEHPHAAQRPQAWAF